MTVKVKRFRIGVEGATTDGREIQREWLEQMAASYNPAVYTALINLEHIKSYLPDSTFNRYGKVTALFAEEITEGPLAGKMALYADVEPTESLVELVKKGQKLFTSMEVSPKFADTGKAYLVGLAATDDPASLGTEMLTFSASAAHKLIADYEGCRLQPYQCSAGVWTDGIGNTSGVIPGKTITERQAAEGLISNVLRVERALERCVKQQPPQKVYDAAVSFAFNVGTGNACSSTLVKLLNQRRWADACRQLPRWVYVKGVFNQGLDNRRAREMAWCLQGAN